MAAGAIVVLLAGCSVDVTSPEGGSAAPRTPGGRSATQAQKRLDDLRVTGAGDMSGYERDRFGQRWKDTDRNGCDQRNDVLARDLDGVEKRGRCVVVAGRLDDPYTGKDISFSKSRATEVQIDHIYPLGLAWRMGADGWDAAKREKFANDTGNLLAVWGRPNQQKSDSGPGEWKPQKSYQCTYAIKFVAVAAEYDLPVTQADHTALEDFLSRC
ncbi:HNH endonuclease family protein [Actinomadura alba]|uniref:HNH endonuclease family protein n=1 Tax=Actinomadura alba TaxID=406431 RepID=UPI0028A6F717|nr:HNH endonuclease family protein [Actinomadura alba]